MAEAQAAENHVDSEAWPDIFYEGTSPIALITLLNIVFRCSSKLSWLSKITPRCFWKAVCLTFVLLECEVVYYSYEQLLLVIV